MSFSNKLYNAQTLVDYNHSEIITPPKKIKKIYSSKDQTDHTKYHLAISYAYLIEKDLGRKKKGVQLFEIPPTEDNCQSYCGLGYGNTGGGLQNEWWNPDSSYVRIFDINDFSCRKGFEKVFQYGEDNNHLARQWGDGTILHKMGCTSYGATPVYRVIDAHHPHIIDLFGFITKIWIKPSQTDVPVPYLRWQSTHVHNYISSGYDCTKQKTMTIDQLKQSGNNKWQDYYKKMCQPDTETIVTNISQQPQTISDKPFQFFSGTNHLNSNNVSRVDFNFNPYRRMINSRLGFS